MRRCGLIGWAHLRVAHHAPNHLRKFIGIVSGTHDAFERVAANTIEQRGFLFRGSRNTEATLRVGKLRNNIFRLRSFKSTVVVFCAARSAIPAPFKIVADCAILICSGPAPDDSPGKY